MKTKIIILCLLYSNLLSAQTWEEWTQQKKTRIKRLMEQIAANRVYIEYAKKGYKIVSGGLHTIRNIKDGEFSLHFGFVDSLKIVNPEVKNWTRVADIIASQLRIIRAAKQAIEMIRESGQFKQDELGYYKMIFDNLMRECVKGIDELLLVITNGLMSMSDDERLRRIEKIFLDMQDKSAFAVSFSKEISLLAMQRLGEQTEINYSKKLNGY